jgi:hypothetical protein
MTKRKNEYGIKCLLMYPIVQIIEPATQARVSLKATVEFFPDAYLPEFVEVQSLLRQGMENKKMTIEAAAGEILDFFDAYEPKDVKIKVDTINSPFFTVSVLADREEIVSVNKPGDEEETLPNGGAETGEKKNEEKTLSASGAEAEEN